MRLSTLFVTGAIAAAVAVFPAGCGNGIRLNTGKAVLPPSANAARDAFSVEPDWEVFESSSGEGTAIDLSISPDANLYLAEVEGGIYGEPPYSANGGNLRVSRDNGRTWAVIPLSIPKNFYLARVAFLSPHEGFAMIQKEAFPGRQIGGEVRVLHTIDGGTTWTESAIIPGLHATSFGVLDSGVGWVVGADSSSWQLGHYTKGAAFSCPNFISGCDNFFSGKGKTKYGRNSALEDAFSPDGNSLTTLAENGDIWSYSFIDSALSKVTTIRAVSPDPPFGMGFSKILAAGDSFIALRGSNYRGSTWTKLSRATNNTVADEQLLNDTYILDIGGNSELGFFACGYTQAFIEVDAMHSRIENDGVIYYSDDGSEWRKIMVRRGVIRETSDGGATWRMTRGPDIKSDFFAITRLQLLADGSVGLAGSDGLFFSLRHGK